MCHQSVKQGVIHKQQMHSSGLLNLVLRLFVCLFPFRIHFIEEPMKKSSLAENCAPNFSIKKLLPQLLSFLTSCANLCYQVCWPAVCHLYKALNKKSPRTWGTSVFSWTRTQQHNLVLPIFPIPVCVSLYKCVCVCVRACGWVVAPPPSLLCHHIMLCYWPPVFRSVGSRAF